VYASIIIYYIINLIGVIYNAKLLISFFRQNISA
jgi:hypothetical protein